MLPRVSLWATGVLACGLALGARGCESPPCTSGVLPFDGQTAVPLDAVVRFAGPELPIDQPAMDEAVGLMDWEGRSVQTELVVQRDGRVVLTPADRLQPDRTYTAVGIDLSMADDPFFVVPHHTSASPREVAPATVTFTTQSKPSLVNVVRAQGFSEGQRELIVVVSEPVQSDDAERIVLQTVEDLAGLQQPRPLEATYLGPLDDNLRLLRFAIARDLLDTEAVQVSVDRLTSRDGLVETLAPAAVRGAASWDRVPVGRYTGEVTCDF